MDARTHTVARHSEAGPRRVARHLFHAEYGYFARMAVPECLRAIVGKRELWAAIHADSDARAVRKLHAAVAGFQATIEAARAEAKAGRGQAMPAVRKWPLSPRQLAVAQYDDRIRADDELRNSDHRYSRGFVDSNYVEQLRTIVSGGADNREMRETLGAVARYYENRGNIKAQFGTPEWREAVRALAVAELESLARTAERDDGDFTGTPRHPLLTEKPQPIAAKDPLAVRIIGPDSTKTLSEIVPDFIRERHASPHTNFECIRTAKLFEESLGDAKPLYSITRQDVRRFKQVVAELPASATKRFPGLAVPEAIKANKARSTPYAPVDTRTINEKYLSKLHSMFNWCVRNDIIPDNPATGIKIEALKSKEPPRVNFSPSDLTKIFSHARYDKGTPFDEQQWAELCALFTGTRASELAQVKLDSIRHERGVLVMAIEEETKNRGSRRLIPVHSTLLALGLEKRVAELRKSGATHLFPEWYRKGTEAKETAKRNGKLTLNLHFPRFIPRAFIATILPKLGIQDSRKVWHSFRHTFTTGLARAGVPRSMQDDLCGHADSSAHAGYVHGESVEAMRDAIEKLRFDGFTLAH